MKPSMPTMDGSAFWKSADRLRESVPNPAKAPKLKAAHQSYLWMTDSAPQLTSAVFVEKIGVDILDGQRLVIGQCAELLLPGPLRKCPPFCRKDPIIRSNLSSGISRKFWIRSLAGLMAGNSM